MTISWKNAATLYGGRVPLPQRALEVGGVVDAHRAHEHRAARLQLRAEIRPQPAHHLGQRGGAVVVGLDAALQVAHDEQHGDAPGVRRHGGGFLGLVEPGEHHLQGRLDHEAAGLEVDDPVERAGIGRGDHPVQGRAVVAREPVGRRHQLPLGETRHVAPRVVVRGVGDADPARVLEQAVAGERVTDREVVVLGLGGEVQPAVFAHAQESEAREGGRGGPRGLAERARPGAAGAHGEPVAHLLPDQGDQLVHPALERGGIEIHLLVGDPAQPGAIAALDECARRTDGVDVRLAEQVRQGEPGTCDLHAHILARNPRTGQEELLVSIILHLT